MNNEQEESFWEMELLDFFDTTHLSETAKQDIIDRSNYFNDNYDSDLAYNLTKYYLRKEK